ncbi:acyltransferase [Rhodoferax sp.]|uniref:acyltransferase family protein n=1 Tax=Rhodoferax sp. TaxID=50421 RepID=UPI002615028A|nr:acyltransferase [Rhodoferax sp.]MDD2918623.1 acyltransferase [Rhodoferax sp.]
MAEPQKNSFDLLRLIAATFVLFSHEFAILGTGQPEVFAWTTLGGFGVSIFFFLSGFLVWTSWAQDPDLKRFFIRRSLRIFPALWVAVLLCLLILGLFQSSLSVVDYFESATTWRYLFAGVFGTPNELPGVFVQNPLPSVVNGSLWTLRVECLCYVSVALLGSIGLVSKNGLMALSLGLAVLAAAYGSLLVGVRFIPHLEMVSLFWWGVMYGYVRAQPAAQSNRWAVAIVVALLAFLLLGTRGVERTGILVLVAALVMAAQHAPWGARLTDRLGDLSYGMYIFAFPVQQTVVALGRSRGWTFLTHVTLSLLITSVLAYVSWHALEKRALRFKPKSRSLA